MKSVHLYKNLPGFKNLSQEQMVTARRWDDEKLLQRGLFFKLKAARTHAEKMSILDEMQETVPDVCEHGKRIESTCFHCDNIEAICLGIELEPDESTDDM